MDYTDSPNLTQKQRRERPKNSFQYELDQKMKERRAKGLSVDITSEESESLGDDSEDESMMREFRMRQRADRPTSAKRRSNTSPLGETLRASDSKKWLKLNKPKTEQENIPSVRGASPYDTSHTSQHDIDSLFGSSKPSRASPKEESIFGKSRTSPVDRDLYGKSRSSPTSSSTFPKAVPGDRKSPLTKEPSKEDLIFGRKTPTKDQQKAEPKEKKEWHAPSFRKQSPMIDQDRAPSPAGSKGRRTPQELDTISESSTPTPKPRHARNTSPKDFTLRSKETSPRSGISLESTIRSEPRSRPKVDIFGKKEAEVSFEDDEKRHQAGTSRERRRFPDPGRKTPTEQAPGARGRRTPTEEAGRKTPTDRFGRTTPPGRKTPTFTTGRTTPTGKGRFDSKSKLEEEREKHREREEAKTKKEPGLFDFLADNADSTKESPKHKPRLRGDRLREQRENEKAGLKKSVSHDSITEELAHEDHPSLSQPLPKSSEMKKMADDSSICEDMEEDPAMRAARQKEREKAAKSGTQRSDKVQADNAIGTVADAQHTETVKTDRPASAAKKSKTPRPKPRHSLPGSAMSDRSDEMFNSTLTIRQAIYEEWRKEKMKKTKQELAEKKKQEEEKKKKEEKEKMDKLLESKASYNAWMEQKESTFVKEKQKEKKKKKKEEEKKEQEKEEKQKEATINFRMWKEKKDEKIIQEHQRRVEEKHRKLQQEKAKKREKEKDSETAFTRWKSRKDEKLVENHHQKQVEEKKTLKLKAQQEKQKEEEATKQYYEWLAKKEKQKEREKERRRQKMNEVYSEDFRPAWSPASRTIPYGR